MAVLGHLVSLLGWNTKHEVGAARKEVRISSDHRERYPDISEKREGVLSKDVNLVRF